MTLSPAEVLAHLPEQERERTLADLGPDQVEELIRSWEFWARPEQRAPEWAWRWWVIVAGRGYGKNRTGAEWVADRCEQFAAHGHRHQVGLVNRTFGHVRSLQIDGESGLQGVCDRRGHRLHHPKTSQEGAIRVWDEGWQTSIIEIHTADDPDRARGRNLHTVHCDEAAAWRHKTDSEGGTAFTNIDFALRSPAPAGLQPQGLVTTTPRPIKFVRDLVDGVYGATAVTRGSMYDNKANLAPSFIRAVLDRYEGTRLGAQEIHGVILTDIFGALWTLELIDQARTEEPQPHDRRVVAVDPPGGTVTECGIVVAGRHAALPMNRLRHADVLADYSMAGPAEAWAKQVIRARDEWGCDAIIAERNFGEDMVRSVIHNVDPSARVIGVRASQSKQVRAEPVTLMYDKRRVHHVGRFVELEEEMTTWVPKGTIDEYGVDRSSDFSPNRLDALVWALADLLPSETVSASASSPNRRAATPSAAWAPSFG